MKAVELLDLASLLAILMQEVGRLEERPALYSASDVDAIRDGRTVVGSLLGELYLLFQ